MTGLEIGAHLEGARLERAFLEGVKLEGAEYSSETLFPPDLDRSPTA